MEDGFELEELVQSRPSGTSATQAYQPDARAVVNIVYICNTTASAADASLYIDWNGTTYDQSTALFYGVEIPANSTTVIDEQMIPLTSQSNLAVQTSIANALTFTVYGKDKVRR